MRMLEGKAKAREQLILQYQRLVIALARRLRKGKPPSVLFEDLVAYGWIGLCEAAQRFDETRGATFSSYAWPRIRGAMLDGLTKMHRDAWQTSFIADLPLFDAPSQQDAEGEIVERLTAEQLKARLSTRDAEEWALFAATETQQLAADEMGVTKSWANRKRTELIERARRIAA